MALTSPGAGDLPLFTLQPVADARHAWIGMLLGSVGAPPAAALGRLFGELGLGEALDSLCCIVPADAAGLPDDEAAASLPADRIVWQCPAQEAAGADVARLRRQGFRFVFDGAPAAAGEAAALTVDCAATLPPAAALAVLGRLPGPHLALGVDTYQRFEQCREAGFAWFAGDYPLHPSAGTVTRSNGPGNALLLKLLRLVTVDADTHAIGALLKQDPELSYLLLKLVSSAAFSRPTKLSSLDQAITMLGRNQLQRWLQLLIYAQPGHGGASPLLPRAAFRARMMEALCALRGGDREAQDQAFMTGMFSLLDVLLGQPIDVLIEPLRLADPVREALAGRGGDLGRLLSIVAVAKRGPAPSLPTWLDALGLAPAHLAQGLVAGCGWAVRVSRDL